MRLLALLLILQTLLPSVLHSTTAATTIPNIDSDDYDDGDDAYNDDELNAIALFMFMVLR